MNDSSDEIFFIEGVVESRRTWLNWGPFVTRCISPRGAYPFDRRRSVDAQRLIFAKVLLQN